MYLRRSFVLSLSDENKLSIKTTRPYNRVCAKSQLFFLYTDASRTDRTDFFRSFTEGFRDLRVFRVRNQMLVLTLSKPCPYNLYALCAVPGAEVNM
jgi:hypothetical protein